MTEEKYKVCILTAGIGNRVGHFSDSINNGLLPVNNKAAISYVIEKFPADIEIVIAVGHKKDTVVDYLTLAYPERSFTFVEVDKYTGSGSGPGYSLLACKEHLQGAFIFYTSDTIVLEDVPQPKENWIGIAPVHDTAPYCSVQIKNNLVTHLDDHIKTNNKFAFIGLAGIRDYQEFFTALEQSSELKGSAPDLIDGFRALLDRKLVPNGFTWFDTGSESNYIETNKSFSGNEHPIDVTRKDEILYFVNDRVIKFFADREVAKKRHMRTTNGLQGLTPKIEAHKGSFYSYRPVVGQSLYNSLTAKVLEDFLSWASVHVWRNPKPTDAQKKEFTEVARNFYHTRTKDRVKMFLDKAGLSQEPISINGVNIPSAAQLLESVDWDYLTAGIPSTFHGDLQFDNVLVQKTTRGEHTFLLLDWREDFGGLTEIGDLYYDLARLYGGTLLSRPLIKEGMFSSDMDEQGANYQFFIKSDLTDARAVLKQFVKDNNFDLKKVKIIAALAFLSQSPRYSTPLDTLFYSFGRNMLYKALSA